MQHVYVRATSYEQLKGLGGRVAGVPSAAALELELFFGRKRDLNLGTVRTIFRRAGLTESVRTVRYCCRTVHGDVPFPGVDTPVSAVLWPGLKLSTPSPIWQAFSQHNLVELQIIVVHPEHALRGLKPALRCGERICGTPRCLQVDAYDFLESVPMCAITEFLSGLRLPCLVHLGSGNGVIQPFHSGCGWPDRESVPVLQSFGGTREPAGIFGLGKSGIHMSIGGAPSIADMAAMADSALGPAIRELHVTVEEMYGLTVTGFQAASSRRLMHGSPWRFPASLSSMQMLSIKRRANAQLRIEARAINALHGLQELALGGCIMEGDLTGPCLTQIVCLSLLTQLHTVLARPPPALTSVLVPYTLDAVVPRAVLGIDVPSETKLVPCGAPLGGLA